MSTQNNSNLRVFAFAAGVCLVCSLVVSAAAVSLRGIQEKNALNEKRINILVAAGLANAEESLSAKAINEKFEHIVPVVVDLKTGKLVYKKDPAGYDMYAAANKPGQGHALKNDPAGIKRIANDGSAYLLMKDGAIERVILPVQGYGLWSTMYGFASLELDGQYKITGIAFYKHGETPGLGARITDPTWQAQWDGVLPFKNNSPDIQVVKTGAQKQKGQVDAISGATLTSRGVQNLMNFWLGKQGYNAFLQHIKDGDITAKSLTEIRQGS